MVVCIHTHPFSGSNAVLEYIFSQIVPRIAVPFFFAVSGYFYISNIISGRDNTKAYLKRTIKTYSFWSIIYFFLKALLFFKNTYSGAISFIEFVVTYIIDFIFYGSWYHFWFFPALIISVILTYVLYKRVGLKWLFVISILLYTLGCIGCSYYTLGIRIPFLNILFKSNYFTAIRRVFLMGFPFFTAGGMVKCLYDRFYYNKTKKWQAVCFSVILWLAEIFLVIGLKLQQNIFITFGLFVLVIETLLFLLTHPMSDCAGMGNIARKLANFTYYSHPFVIKVLSAVLGIQSKGNLITLSVILITFVTAICLARLNNKFFNVFLK